MKVGDKVKVKSWEEILKTVDEKYYCLYPCKDGQFTYFNRHNMFQYLSLTGVISEIHPNGNIKLKIKDQICGWWWHPYWLDLIPEELDIDKNCNPKWLIFCMIFQYLSGNCPNSSIFKYMYTPSKKDGGFDFNDFKYDFLNMQKGNTPFPDWPILNIPLDKAYKILEHCYKYGSLKKDLKFFTYKVSAIIFGGFPWNSVPEGYKYWSSYRDAMILKEKLEKSSIQQKISTTQIKTENHENKLQRKKSIVIRGTVPEGSITCGRKRKTSIAVGYLSNSVCIGG